MKDKYFLDSNVCVYLLEKDTPKQAIAQSLLQKDIPYISTQVVGENVNVCLRKLKFSKEDAFLHAENLIIVCKVSKITENTIKQAFLISKKYQYSYYDSLIIASAFENDCAILYSEDMQHGQIIENSLQILNPFIQ